MDLAVVQSVFNTIFCGTLYRFAEDGKGKQENAIVSRKNFLKEMLVHGVKGEILLQQELATMEIGKCVLFISALKFGTKIF